MAIYKSFWSKDWGTPNKWLSRTIDIAKVESWEFVSKEVTRVYMCSGDILEIKYPDEEFGDLVCAFTDGYGKLFTFNKN